MCPETNQKTNTLRNEGGTGDKWMTEAAPPHNSAAFQWTAMRSLPSIQNGRLPEEARPTQRRMTRRIYILRGNSHGK
jgi:hypothetical protein